MKISLKKLKQLFTWRQHATTSPVQPDRDKLSTEKALIDEYMDKSNPFLFKHYTIFQLSEETGIPLNDLIAIIHHQGFTGFNDFIACYRINYCKQLLDQVPIFTVDVFDLTAICGFTDQKQFCEAFKKVTHIPISKYIRRLCREQQVD